MSPSETKRSKRRKNKRGRVMQKPVGESSGNEFNPACIDTDTSAIQSTVLEEMQRLMDEENAEDGAAQNASFSSDLYLGGERCLLCQCERLRMEDDGSNDGVSGEIESDDKNASSAQLPLWVCPDCKKMVEEEQNRGSFDPKQGLDNLSIGSEAASLPGELESSVENPDTAAVCQCDTCNEQRLIEAEQTREMEELRSCWTELKMALHKIYRDTGLSLGEAAGGHQILTNTGGPLPPTDHLKRLVFRLCSYNQHKLYQCLEAHVRLFVVEMRLRLLHQLALGPQVGKSFVRAMLEEYAKLCLASKQMAPLLQELEAKHLRRFNLTWELVNRRLFQCIVYCDPILHTGLPELSPARLNSPNKDKCHHETYSALTKFDDEMTVIAVVWREAQQLIDDYDQEQAAARTVRTKKRTALKEWEMFNSHWQLLEDELTKKGNFQFVRQCSYNECTASQHLNSTHLASNLLTPMELASLAEQASGTACSHLAYSSHNGKVPAHMNAHHQENACNTLSGSSVPSHCENQGQMMHCVDQEACHSMVASHLDDAPPPLLKMSKVCDGSIAEDGDRTAEDSGGSKCPSASPENSFTATNGSLQQCCGGCSESQCCHKSFSSSSPPPSKRVSTISHAAASNKPTFFPNPSLTSQVSGGCAELSNQHELHGGEPHEDFWKDIILEKVI